MKRRLWLVWLLAALLLAACGKGGGEQTPPMPQEPPAAEPQKPPVESVVPDMPENTPEPVLLKDLTVELVVDWQGSGQLLQRLEELAQLLQMGLARQGVDAEQVTVTISTAGGVTADALSGGGVDAAILPAVDYLSCEGAAVAVLTSDDTPCRTVVAVSAQLEGAVREALGRALLETKDGMVFLEACAPGDTMVPAGEEALQALRDWAAEQEEDHGA